MGLPRAGCCQVEDEVFRGHRIVLTARSPVFRALLSSGMREAEKGEVQIQDVRPAVFKVTTAIYVPPTRATLLV